MTAAREWYSASELASLCVAGLPTTKRGINKRAGSEKWQHRDRAGSGGGREYHLSSLPAETRAALLLRERRSAPIAPVPNDARLSTERSTALWEQWERKPAAIRDEAQRRFDAIMTVEELVASATPRLEAYAHVAESLGESASTVRRWVRLVRGVHRGDWLPVLAPRWKGRVVGAEYDPRAYQLFRDLYLSPSRPAARTCYRRVEHIAREQGFTIPSLATLWREMQRREDPVVVAIEREGEKRAQEMFPYLSRTTSADRAMQRLNADGHRLDLDTVWPDGERVRTTLIAFQDIYSRQVVGWRLSKAESAHEMGLAFLDVCDRHGICEHLYVDNTLAMASKRMTAGAKGRHRFKDKDDDPLGVLPTLGVTVHFTTPAHGQAKPIERAFRDLAERIAKHPAFEGAYLGANTQAKPHNYGERTITVAELERIVAAEVVAHNQQPNRRTEACAGTRSFQEAFDSSYAQHEAEIRRATASQRRLLYLIADVVTVDRRDGCVKVLGNRYWSEPVSRLRGQKVVVRYHPTERTMHDAVCVYGLNGDFIDEAPCYAAAGFADAEAAQRHTRARRQFVKAKKDLAKAGRHLNAATIAAMVPAPELPNESAAARARVDFTLPSTPEQLGRVAAAKAATIAREAAGDRLANAMLRRKGEASLIDAVDRLAAATLKRRRA